MGVVYGDLSEPQKALDFLDQALTLSKSQGARSEEAFALNEIGSVYAGVGEKQRALEYFSNSTPRPHG